MPGPATFLLSPLLAVLIFAMMLPVNDFGGAIAGLVAALALTTILIAKAPVIEVTTGALRVGRALIERRFLGAIEVIGPEDVFAARGHQLDARAFTSIQGTVRTMLKIEITDEADATPYWLFTTRNPEELKKVLS